MEDTIRDYQHYTTEMRKSLIDKIFFMDKLESSFQTILDYGCADGTLIGFLAQNFPEYTFLGYDLNPEMTRLATERFSLPNTRFFSDLDELRAYLSERQIDPAQVSLNLSSLIHEVYSYGTETDIQAFWSLVNEFGFGCITIRDMCLEQAAHRLSLKEDVLKVRRAFPADKIQQFEACHGSLSDNYQLIHLLMKYRYEQNWQRECAENYLPLTLEEIAAHLNPSYEIVYFDHYVLPFLQSVVKRDFDITIKDYTHVKLIMKKKGL